MGILDWFRSGEGGGSGHERDPDREVTPGGSVVYHYGRDSSGPQPGDLSEEQIAEYRAQREAAYRELFGEPASIYREVVSLTPRIDIYVYPAGQAGRDFTTLITGGMSDLPMTVPAAVGAEARRAELVLYVAEPNRDYASMLRFLAHFPHDNKTWFGHGHTMPNGQPPAPLFPDSDLDTFLLRTPSRESDAALRSRLVLSGDPVNLIWVTPITTAECQFKLDHGADALIKRIDRQNYPIILDECRRSAV